MVERFGIIFFSEIIKNILNKLIKNNNKILNYLKNIISISLSAQIVIMPIMIYSFKTVSLTFLIANILTSFLISIIIIFGFSIIIISLISIKIAKTVGIIYSILINSLVFITELTSKIPFSKIYVKTPYLYQIIFYYILIFIILMIKKYKNKEKFLKYKKQIIVIILIIILIPNIFEIIPNGKLQIYFIDVGQGDSCLIKTPQNKTILIDRRRK